MIQLVTLINYGDKFLKNYAGYINYWLKDSGDSTISANWSLLLELIELDFSDSFFSLVLSGNATLSQSSQNALAFCWTLALS